MRTISPSGSDSNSEPSGLAVRRDGLSSVSMNVEILLSMSSLSLAVFVIIRTVIHCDSESVLFCITCTRTFVLRAGRIEVVAYCKFEVVTAVGPYAYQRPDGVFVVPIGCLKD